MKEQLHISSKIRAYFYIGNLPVSYGHIDFGNGRAWLGVCTAEGYTKKGYGSRVVKALCEHADNGGLELWLTCKKELINWYKRFGFEETRETSKSGTHFMKRGNHATQKEEMRNE